MWVDRLATPLVTHFTWNFTVIPAFLMYEISMHNEKQWQSKNPWCYWNITHRARSFRIALHNFFFYHSAFSLYSCVTVFTLFAFGCDILAYVNRTYESLNPIRGPSIFLSTVALSRATHAFLSPSFYSGTGKSNFYTHIHVNILLWRRLPHILRPSFLRIIFC